MHSRGLVGGIVKLAIFLAAFLIVLWFLIEWKLWSGDYTLLLFRTEQWGTLLLLLGGGLILGKIMELLLVHLWHNEFVAKHRRRQH